MSESENKTAESQNTQPKSKLKLIIAVCVVVIVIAVAAVWGWNAYQANALNTAEANCAEASETTRVAQNQYNALVNGDAADASEITADEVKDASTVENLAKLLDEEPPTSGTCAVDGVDALNEQVGVYETSTKWYGDQLKALEQAVQAVNDSKISK